jgi:hypothetical protein
VEVNKQIVAMISSEFYTKLEWKDRRCIFFRSVLFAILCTSLAFFIYCRYKSNHTAVYTLNSKKLFLTRILLKIHHIEEYLK